MKSQAISGRIFSYSELPSTQNEAKRLLKMGEDTPFTIAADAQITGKGRFSRKWISPPGGTYLSWVINSTRKIGVASVVAIVMCKTLAQFAKGEILVKWPNDLMYNGKKVAGILVEVIGENIIVGIGVNTFPIESIDDEIIKFAAAITMNKQKRESFIERFFDSLAPIWQRFCENGFDSFIDEYLSVSIPIGTRILLTRVNEEISGSFAGITAKGELIIHTGETIRTFAAGDTSILRTG